MRARTLVVAVVMAAVLFPVNAEAQRWRRRRNNDVALGVGLAALTTGLILNNEAKQQRRAAERAGYYSAPAGYYVPSRPSGYSYPTSNVVETGAYYARDQYGRPVVVREYIQQQPRVVREVQPYYYYSY
jgi:hypothetical protein